MPRPPLVKMRTMMQRVQEEQLRDLLINRHIFDQFRKATKNYVGKRHGAQLAEWLVQNYAAFVSTTIRRLTEEPKPLPKKPKKPRDLKRSISLVILLDELKKHASKFPRDRFRERYAENGVPSEFADRDFAIITGDASATVLTTAHIDRDLKAIERITRPVMRLVNKMVAHTEYDRRLKGRQTWGQIDAAIDRLREIIRRYSLLLIGSYSDPPLDQIDVMDDLRLLWP